MGHRGNPSGKSGALFNVGNVRRPGAVVEVIALDHPIDFGLVPAAGVFLSRRTRSGDSADDDCRDDPQDRHDGQELQKREGGTLA